MATTTTRLGLRKPATTDLVSVITDVSDNMQKLDDSVKGVIKLTQEIINNSSTFQNDDELFFSIAANEKWIFSMLLIVDCATDAPGFKIFIPGIAGAIGDFTAQWIDNTDQRVRMGRNGLGNGLILTSIETNSFNSVLINGFVSCGATPGTLQLQWAQNVATVQNTMVWQNSYIIAHRIL